VGIPEELPARIAQNAIFIFADYAKTSINGHIIMDEFTQPVSLTGADPRLGVVHRLISASELEGVDAQKRRGILMVSHAMVGLVF
jgi:hypothetical protein